MSNLEVRENKCLWLSTTFVSTKETPLPSSCVAMDTNILSVLQGSGLNSNVVEKLEKASDARLHGERGRDTFSFFNYLGIGCVFYEDIDRG